ncbi:MAG TPA: efflux RND transporter periplasmic adaptor subunit [Steroidobacteraceae bacterium]|jgi:Cu(I)/Ag(I) efflux system membrane fusion protein|nr:efflux RND transporter periplasmic adaptor subunit [Steroidobacteraceae bacterium]
MKRSYSIGMAAALIAAIAITFLVISRNGGGKPTKSAACGNAAPAYWYDPMRPTEHFDKPGKSPFMDMQLAPKCPNSSGAAPGSSASQGNSASPGSIEIDSRVVANLGVRMAKVEEGSFARSTDTVGLVGVDEHRIEAMQVREPGWVEELNVRAVGDLVRRGQQLAGIYSPELLAVQQELLIARGANDPTLIEAARQRLALFGLSAAQIARIEQSGESERRVAYYAPFDGYVMELGVRQGAALQPGATLFQIASLESVWITADVPESQAGWISPGDPAEVTVPALPGMSFKAQVDYLYPELMQSTRSLKVRVVVKNPQHRLRPGMFAAVHFRGLPLEKALTVPTEAVIKTGTRSVVIVADDGTHFRPVVVRVGAEHGGRSEILEGLRLGQSVVASGQFLIDSEASLRSAFDNLAGASDATQMEMKPDLMPSPGTQAPEGAN